jgi:hypothetical protein
MASVNEPVDQANAMQSMVVNGVHALVNVATLKTTAGSTNVYRFSKSFAFRWNGQTIDYKQNGIYALDAALKTALIAASAPMTQQ